MDSTRDRIVAEALRLFTEQGYASTSVAAIGEAAGLSPKSEALYTHLGSKERTICLRRRALGDDLVSSLVTGTATRRSRPPRS
ncbi:helix-turn-helix domain-containing protein [Nocardia asiatica]|uniref:helix-turn-helix domain-containing protein n=1 Tax=Nocardia asiatica TaxID=209252 RepID=UPI003CC7DFB2